MVEGRPCRERSNEGSRKRFGIGSEGRRGNGREEGGARDGRERKGVRRKEKGVECQWESFKSNCVKVTT